MGINIYTRNINMSVCVLVILWFAVNIPFMCPSLPLPLGPSSVSCILGCMEADEYGELCPHTLFINSHSAWFLVPLDESLAGALAWLGTSLSFVQ